MPAYAICLPLLLSAAVPAAAASLYQGRVIAVTDGQSIVALLDNRRAAVRIAGIEAPTGAQRLAIGARQSLVAVCGGEPARIAVEDTRADGTLVARVSCNGIDAGAEQVRRGMATVASRDTVDYASLSALEADARAARRGLWSTRAPMRREAR